MEHVDEYVNLIASGYDWVCPVCEDLNHEIEYTETVTCKCGKTFGANSPYHAWGF